MIKDIFNENKIFIFFGVLFALFASTYHWYFLSNQNTYLLHAFHLSQPDILNVDWFNNTVDGTPIFSFVSSYLFSSNNFFILNFNKFFEVIFYIYLSKIVLNGLPNNKRLELNVLILLIALSSCIFPIFIGLKGQYILGNIYQPSIYGVFLLPALFYYLKNQNFKSFFCIFIATIFHPSLMFASIVLGIIFLANLKKDTQKIFFLFSGILIFLPLFTYIYIYIYVPEFSEVAADILVGYRLPHHADLSSFKYLDIIRLLILGLSIFLCRDILLKRILIIVTALMIFFILLANLLDFNSFNLLFPLRLSILFIPIAVVIVSVEFFLILKKYLIKNIYEKIFLFFCTLLVCLLVFINALKISDDIKVNPYLDWASYTSPNESWLTPISDPLYFVEGIRLNLSQPIFVDYKSHPLNSKDVKDWKDKIDLSQRFYLSKNVVEQESILREINKISKINYILVNDFNNYFIDSEIIFISDGMTLYKVN